MLQPREPADADCQILLDGRQGKSDAELRAAADALVAGTRAQGVTGQLRSFTWPCRSAVATPYFLR